jgi:hypothetical protein
VVDSQTRNAHLDDFALVRLKAVLAGLGRPVAVLAELYDSQLLLI